MVPTIREGTNITVRDVAAAKPVASFAGPDHVDALAVDLDLATVASGQSYGTFELWTLGSSESGFAVSGFVFGFRSLSCIPDGSEVPIRVWLQDKRATEARLRFFGP
jgi:hypothetical protein